MTKPHELAELICFSINFRTSRVNIYPTEFIIDTARDQPDLDPEIARRIINPPRLAEKLKIEPFRAQTVEPDVKELLIHIFNHFSESFPVVHSPVTRSSEAIHVSSVFLPRHVHCVLAGFDVSMSNITFHIPSFHINTSTTFSIMSKFDLQMNEHLLTMLDAPSELIAWFELYRSNKSPAQATTVLVSPIVASLLKASPLVRAA